jgi:O-acetyl-ADP-ribose deacetylase (regulator of RNase III)
MKHPTNLVLDEHTYESGSRIQIVQGDLTKENVDAIVNAANAHLRHGGGVAGAIARKGGAQVRSESKAWIQQHGPVSHDSPAYTRAGRLPCKYIIHAVGPAWGAGDEDAKLSAAVLGSLEVAGNLELSSIAFPAISTGIFGFPKGRAAEVILNTVSDYLTQFNQSSVRLVRLTLYDQPTIDAFLKAWHAKGLGKQE